MTSTRTAAIAAEWGALVRREWPDATDDDVAWCFDVAADVCERRCRCAPAIRYVASSRGK